MIFLVKNFEKLKQKEWSFCGFVQKIQNIVIFTIFDWYRFKNSNIHKDFVCFSFPCPLPAKMVSGFCKAKSKRKWTNRQMCGINSHLLLFWKFVQRKEKFIFFEQFSWFLAKITFFETWNIFFESAFHIFQKQFAIHLAFHDETFSNANKEIFVFKQSNRGQICCFKPICRALLVCYCF